MSGIFAVTFSVIFAYVADITEEQERSTAYGLVRPPRCGRVWGRWAFAARSDFLANFIEKRPSRCRDGRY